MSSQPEPLYITVLPVVLEIIEYSGIGGGDEGYMKSVVLDVIGFRL